MTEPLVLIVLIGQIFTFAIIGYFVKIYREDQEAIEKKVLRKVKGIKKKDQQNIDKIGQAIEKDVEGVLANLRDTGETLEIPDFPELQSLVNSDPGILSGAIGTNWFDILVPLITNVAGNSDSTIMSLLSNANMKNVAVAGIAYKIYSNFMKNRSTPSATNNGSSRQKNEYIKSNW